MGGVGPGVGNQQLVFALFLILILMLMADD